MGSCPSCSDDHKDIHVKWYRPGSPESQKWLLKMSGMGYLKRKSFADTTLIQPEVNRKGNMKGELAGKIVFYKQARSKMDYSQIPKCPTLTIGEQDTLFAKCFFKVPLSRIPIGENNVISGPDFRGQGGVILASKPRLVAIYIDVNGQPVSSEHLCKRSQLEVMLEDRVALKEEQWRNDFYKNMMPKKAPRDVFEAQYKKVQLQLTEPVFEPTARARLIKEPIPGSFFTYSVSKNQEPYFFLHFPLIGSLDDASIVTGSYGESLIPAFCELVQKLPPGYHTIDMRVWYWYDHRHYSGYVLDRGTNPLGRWYKDINNSRLKYHHKDQISLNCSTGPIAKGKFILHINAKLNFEYNWDREPPPEVYTGDGSECIRKTARIVAAGKLCDMFGLSGMPDWVVLCSPITKDLTTDTLTIDLAALWLNPTDLRAEAFGIMVLCRMAKQDSETEEWTWEPLTKGDVVIDPWKLMMKNKYINIRSKNKRFQPGTVGRNILSRMKRSMSLM